MEVSGWDSVVGAAYAHSSSYLLATLAVSVGSVLLVWLLEQPACRKYFFKNVTRNISQADVRDEPGVDAPDEDFLTGARTISTKTLVEQIEAQMTPEQREIEKKVEKEQLQAIFSLLQETQEKFNVASMEQLEEQLSLYR